MIQALRNSAQNVEIIGRIVVTAQQLLDLFQVGFHFAQYRLMQLTLLIVGHTRVGLSAIVRLGAATAGLPLDLPQ